LRAIRDRLDKDFVAGLEHEEKNVARSTSAASSRFTLAFARRRSNQLRVRTTMLRTASGTYRPRTVL
jgi:hypothetical protein